MDCQWSAIEIVYFYTFFVFQNESGTFKEASRQLLLETSSKYIIVSMVVWSISVYFHIVCLIYDVAIRITLNKATQFPHLFMYQARNMSQCPGSKQGIRISLPGIILAFSWLYSLAIDFTLLFYILILYNLSSSWFFLCW